MAAACATRNTYLEGAVSQAARQLLVGVVLRVQDGLEPLEAVHRGLQAAARDRAVNRWRVWRRAAPTPTRTAPTDLLRDMPLL